MISSIRKTIVGFVENVQNLTKPKTPKQTTVTPLRAADLPATMFDQHKGEDGRRLGREDPRMMAEETYQREVTEKDQLKNQEKDKEAVLNTGDTLGKLERSLQRMAK